MYHQLVIILENQADLVDQVSQDYQLVQESHIITTIIIQEDLVYQVIQGDQRNLENLEHRENQEYQANQVIQEYQDSRQEHHQV